MKNKKLLKIFLLLPIVIAFGIFSYFYWPIQNNENLHDFTKEGQLTFFESQSQNSIIKIDIEIADTAKERAEGLMYRESIPEKAGMLFVFDEQTNKSFWMKNTFVPLDIIFIDENLQIVTIQKNTVPFSETSIPSYKAAIYVVEVNAGFCDKYEIQEGDFIDFL